MKIEVENMTGKIALAVKKTAVDMSKLTDVFNELTMQLMKHLSEHGGVIVCAPYCEYSNGNEDYTQFDIEFGIPVDKPLPEKNGLYMTKTFEGKAITATHKGAYNTLEPVYEALMAYAKEYSLELTGVYYDFYLNNPEDTPEDELLTKIVFSLK